MNETGLTLWLMNSAWFLLLCVSNLILAGAGLALIFLLARAGRDIGRAFINFLNDGTDEPPDNAKLEEACCDAMEFLDELQLDGEGGQMRERLRSAIKASFGDHLGEPCENHGATRDEMRSMGGVAGGGGGRGATLIPCCICGDKATVKEDDYEVRFYCPTCALKRRPLRGMKRVDGDRLVEGPPLARSNPSQAGSGGGPPAKPADVKSVVEMLVQKGMEEPEICQIVAKLGVTTAQVAAVLRPPPQPVAPSWPAGRLPMDLQAAVNMAMSLGLTAGVLAAISTKFPGTTIDQVQTIMAELVAAAEAYVRGGTAEPVQFVPEAGVQP